MLQGLLNPARQPRFASLRNSSHTRTTLKALVAPGEELIFRSGGGVEFVWVKRPYTAAGDPPPRTLLGSRAGVQEVENVEVPGSYERLLLPLEPAFDFTMMLLSFDPGVAFHQVEIHDEDHGIYFTAGGGIYLLDRERYEVATGDFIYLAPYCPQHFIATGESRAEYLLYKPVNRDGFVDATCLGTSSGGVKGRQSVFIVSCLRVRGSPQ